MTRRSGDPWRALAQGEITAAPPPSREAASVGQRPIAWWMCGCLLQSKAGGGCSAPAITWVHQVVPVS